MRKTSLALTVLLLLASTTGEAAHAWPWRAPFVDVEHFSPAENLEQLDIDALDHARGTVDIAVYAFTDRYIAQEPIKLANRGVHIRLYRDREQFLSEQGRRDSTTDMMAGVPNIEIRVKRSKVLAHLKAFCVDNELLRDGSANWSPTGLKRQDNNARYTTAPAEVRGLRRTSRRFGTGRGTRSCSNFPRRLKLSARFADETPKIMARHERIPGAWGPLKLCLQTPSSAQEHVDLQWHPTFDNGHL